MKINKHLILSGILFTIVLFLWPIFMGISQPQGSDIEQLNWIKNHSIIFKIQFFFAFLISPSIIYLMLSQLDKYHFNNNISKRLGLIFIIGYFVLNSISYASQIILVPKFVNSGLMEQARVWYFMSSSSISYFINQMGYCFWGIGTMILFVRLIKKNGIIKYLSLIYVVSAILSIIAFFGLMLDSEIINSMTLYGGLVLIPCGIMTVIWGVQENKKIKTNDTQSSESPRQIN
jgi:CDP-diacylglycerol--glycerol-3-phosphate 3-phosphatidyltransferase